MTLNFTSLDAVHRDLLARQSSCAENESPSDTMTRMSRGFLVFSSKRATCLATDVHQSTLWDSSMGLAEAGCEAVLVSSGGVASS